jgi:chorismate dehydratase
VEKKLIITATSYLNTIPFVYGIERGGFLKNYELLLDVPSGCARNLAEGKADIGLVPVGAITQIDKSYEILYDYCLGANGKVNTVLLLSRVPLKEIKDIYLDFESATSVRLVKILAEHYWGKYDINWRNINRQDTSDYIEYTSLLAIGDKTFELVKEFEYKYDLAEEWYKFTGLPFVFACWMKRNTISGDNIVNLTMSLKYGVEHKLEAVREYKNRTGIKVNLEEYVEKYMSYEFDSRKQEALGQFISLLVH